MDADSGTRHTLRYWRLNAGLSQGALAARAGVSKPTVLRAEHDRPGIDGLVRLMTVSLGIPPDLLRAGPPEEPITTFAAIREEASESVTALSFRTGVSSAVIRRAESGAAIQPDVAKRLSDAMGVRVTDWYPLQRVAECSHSS